MNHLIDTIKLNNKYFVLRHGESLANVENIIVSTPENGLEKYGLSDKGRVQIEKTINKAKTDKLLGSKTRIISSDFKRAYESAIITGQILGAEYLIETEFRLRERDFGNFELLSNEHYQEVWDDDELDNSHTNNNVESADAVMQRVTAFLYSLERHFNDQTFLLVAHGDTLQILLTAFKKLPASCQRDIKHLETAEIRSLEF